MNRLLQGDVGSGKTLVALMGILIALDNGYQAALMAPTELLSEQHYKSFKEQLGPLGFSVVWLTSKLKVKDKRAALTAIAENRKRRECRDGDAEAKQRRDQGL